MLKIRQWSPLIIAALSAFCVYTCMYAFRKPFTAANYDGIRFLSIDYKIWLVVAQTVGYTLSKFYGIRFIAELGRKNRASIILLFIALAWLSLLFFALVPAPYNIIFLLLNGFPLGVIYGLVFSYLEGRRSTELLGAVLATSFIFASGFTQSIGKFILLNWDVSDWWMPFITGSIFIFPTLLFTWMLSKTPSPTKQDILLRTERLPMNKSDRKDFIKRFLPGLVLLISTYIMLTIIRDYRSNFAANIWSELGLNNASVFTKSELPASLVTLLLMGFLIFIKKNIQALLINHWIIVSGFLLSITFTLLYINGYTSPFWWMTIVGVGLYMGYVPFNCMLFDRLIASFKYVSNAGFIIYLADSFGYLGSNVILITKNFLKLDISWSDFFVEIILSMSTIGILLTIISAIYFRNKYYNKKMSPAQLKYA
jgi:MFS family permease